MSLKVRRVLRVICKCKYHVVQLIIICLQGLLDLHEVKLKISGPRKSCFLLQAPKKLVYQDYIVTSIVQLNYQKKIQHHCGKLPEKLVIFSPLKLEPRSCTRYYLSINRETNKEDSRQMNQIGVFGRHKSSPSARKKKGAIGREEKRKKKRIFSSDSVETS